MLLKKIEKELLDVKITKIKEIAWKSNYVYVENNWIIEEAQVVHVNPDNRVVVKSFKEIPPRNSAEFGRSEMTMHIVEVSKIFFNK